MPDRAPDAAACPPARDPSYHGRVSLLRRLLAVSRGRLLLLAAVLPLAACGDGASDAPVSAQTQEAGTAPETRALTRLEVLRLRMRTCVALGGPRAEAQIREIAREILDTCDPDDAEARRILGYTDFRADVLGRRLERGEDPIPEEIANRKGYGFLEDVQELDRIRWLREPEEIAHAHEAVAAMREHARRLIDDRLYRLGDGARANLATDRDLGDYTYATAWVPPHLVCYARGEELSEWDLRTIPDYRRRREIRDLVRSRRERLRPAAEEAARVLGWLDTELRRRFGARHGLRPLHAPYGGRPDYAPGVRSYPDGVVLQAVVFDSPEAFETFHFAHRGGPPWPADRGYYLSTDRRIYTFDPGGDETEHARWVRSLLRLGTYQLLQWYGCQKNGWSDRAPKHEFFGTGLAGFLSGVRLGKEGRLELTGTAVDLLRDAQELAASLRARDEPYPLRPLRDLTAITEYGDVELHASDSTSPDAALELYFQQSWMVVLFLQEYDGGRYREGFERYFEAYLTGATQSGTARSVFARCLELEEKDWARLDAELRTFVDEDLLKRELP